MKNLAVRILQTLLKMSSIAIACIYYYFPRPKGLHETEIIPAIALGIFSYLLIDYFIKIYINASVVKPKFMNYVLIFIKNSLPVFISAVFMVYALILPSLLFSDAMLDFFSILSIFIAIRLAALILKSNQIKFFLNIVRFVIIIVAAFVNYGGQDFSNFEYSDRAVLASLIFDTIISSSGVEKYVEKIYKYLIIG